MFLIMITELSDINGVSKQSVATIDSGNDSRNLKHLVSVNGQERWQASYFCTCVCVSIPLGDT